MNNTAAVEPNKNFIIGRSNVVIKNFPTGTTADQLSDFLWEKLGLEVKPEEEINILNHTAFIRFRSKTLAAFFTRYLEGVPMGGRELIVEAKEKSKPSLGKAKLQDDDQTEERWKRKLK
jgi:hypothetical protein